MADLFRAFAAVVFLGVVNLAIMPRLGDQMTAVLNGQQLLTQTGETSTMDEARLFQVAVQQGGLLLVLVIVLFFYRRDYLYLTSFWKDQNTIVTNLVAENTKATTEMATAMRENTVVVQQAKTVMATHLPRKRAEDDHH